MLQRGLPNVEVGLPSQEQFDLVHVHSLGGRNFPVGNLS